MQRLTSGIELEQMLRLADFVWQDFGLHDGTGLNPVSNQGSSPGLGVEAQTRVRYFSPGRMC